MSPARKKKKSRKKKASKRKSSGAGAKRYTLTEISELADISMPTLQKYKKKYARRIPSFDKGRRQRYPRSAIKVFQELKQENLAKRGRGRRRTKLKRKKKAARRSSELLSLQKIQHLTGISYPTLLRYVKLHLRKLPHVGTGRNRRYRPSAVPIFQELRRQSPRGRRAGGARGAVAARAGGGASRAVDRRLAGLERSQANLEKQLRELTRLVKKPYTITLKH